MTMFLGVWEWGGVMIGQESEFRIPENEMLRRLRVRNPAV